MEDCPDGRFEIANSIVVCHSRARHFSREKNAAFHTGGKVGTWGRGNVGDGVINTAAHNVDVAIGFKGVSIGTRTGWRRL